MLWLRSTFVSFVVVTQITQIPVHLDRCGKTYRSFSRGASRNMWFAAGACRFMEHTNLCPKKSVANRIPPPKKQSSRNSTTTRLSFIRVNINCCIYSNVRALSFNVRSTSSRSAFFSFCFRPSIAQQPWPKRQTPPPAQRRRAECGG
jgi:hypothetical protein